MGPKIPSSNGLSMAPNGFKRLCLNWVSIVVLGLKGLFGPIWDTCRHAGTNPEALWTGGNAFGVVLRPPGPFWRSIGHRKTFRFFDPKVDFWTPLHRGFRPMRAYLGLFGPILAIWRRAGTHPEAISTCGKFVWGRIMTS